MPQRPSRTRATQPQPVPLASQWARLTRHSTAADVFVWPLASVRRRDHSRRDARTRAEAYNSRQTKLVHLVRLCQSFAPKFIISATAIRFLQADPVFLKLSLVFSRKGVCRRTLGQSAVPQGRAHFNLCVARVRECPSRTGNAMRRCSHFETAPTCDWARSFSMTHGC